MGGESAEDGRSGVREPLRLLSDSLTAALLGVGKDVARAETVVQSAAEEMLTSFSALNDLAAEQGRAISSAVGLLDADASAAADGPGLQLRAFIDDANGTLGWLTELITTFSKENVRVAYTVEDLVQELETMFELVGAIDGIADDTTLLAINAALEAARAGEAGRGFGVVSSEVRRLSSDTKKLNQRITAHVGKANALVDEVQRAVSWMASRDVAALLERVQALNATTVQLLGHLEALGRQVDARASDAVRALQFEDVANQISRAARARLEGVASALDACVAELDPNLSAEEAIRALVDSFRERVAHLESDARMPAQQSDVSQGEIVLF